MLSMFKTLLEVFRPYRKHLLLLAALGFLSAILEGVGINAVVPLVTFFTGGGSGVPTDAVTGTIYKLFVFLHVPFSFRYLLGFIVILFFLRSVMMVAFGYIRGWVTADFMSKESSEMLRRLLSASWPFLLKQKLGVIQNTLVRDIQRTNDLLFTQVQLIQSATGLVMYLLVAFNISPPTTLFTLVGGGALILVVRPLLVRSQRVGAVMATTEKEVTQFLGEQIIGMKTLKSSGRESRAREAGQRFIDQLRTLSIRMALVRSISASLFQPFSIIFVIVLFALTYNTPGFSIISFAAALYLIQKIFTYLDSAQSSLHGIFELVPYARNVLVFKKILAEHREQRPHGAAKFKLNEGLRFEDVTLSYDGSQEALKGVSFDLPRGSTTGVIGPSGAGKTSVADLILRLFEPTGGRIALDDTAAADIALEEWRGHVGYVSQDVFLLNGSIEDNIRFYRAGLSEEEITEAARQANIHDFVSSLPNGYLTLVGDRGVLLSGGQRQRIALARALAGRPALLVLDEATSALDNESERLIQESIRALRGSVTVFIIAHRLSTIDIADNVLVLEGGKITEQGSPEELRANPNSYLSRMQEL